MSAARPVLTLDTACRSIGPSRIRPTAFSPGRHCRLHRRPARSYPSQQPTCLHALPGRRARRSSRRCLTMVRALGARPAGLARPAKHGRGRLASSNAPASPARCCLQPAMRAMKSIEPSAACVVRPHHGVLNPCWRGAAMSGTVAECRMPPAHALASGGHGRASARPRPDRRRRCTAPLLGGRPDPSRA